MRRCFTEISASGEKDKSYFLANENHEVGQRVEDCMGRIGDRRLREAISEAVQAWKQIFCLSLSPSASRFHGSRSGPAGPSVVRR
jgi:hypothetical protein